MTTTNNLGLPEALVKAVSHHEYDKGDSDISVTQLINPPRKRVLEKLHAKEMSEDASDSLWRLFGSIGHSILQKHAEGLSEHRFFMGCLGWKVSGQVDLIEGSQIIDYKMTSAWSVLEGPKQDWVNQLNLYWLLANSNGIKADSITIIALLRDWSKNDARRNKDYPQTQVVKLNIPVWGYEESARYLKERVMAHQEAEKALPDCTDEDKWTRPTTYALIKKGNIRASKVCSSMKEAEELKKPDQIIETRVGENVRCESYCSAAPFCDFAKGLTKEAELI